MKLKTNRKYNAAYDLINRNVSRNPNKIAFIDNSHKLTYKQLFLKINSLAYSLKSIGFKRNDRILVCLNDSTNYPIAFLGCIWAGIIPICINTLLPKKDYEYMIKDSSATGIIYSSTHYDIFSSILKKNSDPLISIVEGHPDKPGMLSFENLINIERKLHPKPAKTRENDVCFWLYSSGSTGEPKGTLHVHRSLLSTANSYGKKILNIKKNDIFFSAAKLFFAYGLGNALTFPMSIGGTSILNYERPTYESVARTIKKNKVTLFFGVPTLYAQILNSKLNKNDYKSLRLCISAGEALPAHLCNKWQKFLKIKVLDGIGSTEMLHIFISNRIEELIPGSSGRPVPGYTARLIKENGEEAKNDEIAELEISGTSSAIGYWNKKEKTKNTFLKNWTKTGDKYLRNKDGIYTYCGRTDDMMKVSGQYVSPFEIEGVLQKHQSVMESAVVASHDKDNLVKPKAYVVLNKGYEDSEDLKKKLTKHIKKFLTPFKYPRWYEFVDVLPKTATGKIQRYKLRKIK